MSGSAEGGRGGGGHAGATTKKMLQSIKEIVGSNLSDDEIYAMLKECSMDPSEAVHRLLNQDSFQEVKSKREKKKDVKETTESRPRMVTNSNRGSKGAADRGTRASSTHNSSSANYSKPTGKREGGTNVVPTSSASVPVVAKSYTLPSDYTPLEATGGSNILAHDHLPPQYSTAVHQSAWGGMPGQRTLADIVKMGRPVGKASRAPPVLAPTISDTSSHDIIMSAGNHHFSPKLPSSMVKPSESHREAVSTDSAGQHLSHGEWLLADEANAGTSPSRLELRGATGGGFADVPTSSNLPANSVDFHHVSQFDEDSVLPSMTADRQMHLDDSVMDPDLDDSSAKDANSYQRTIHDFKQNEVDVNKVEVSAVSSNLQRLSLETEEASAKQHSDDNPAVIIPNHLQVTNADCSYLSFGTFGSGINTAFSGSFGSKAQNSSSVEVPQELPEPASVPADNNSEARNPEYFSNEHLGVNLNENAENSMSSPNVENYETPQSSSQPDVARPDSVDGLSYRIQSSLPGYTFSNAGEAAAAPSYASVQENSSMQSLAPFSNVMQVYPSSLPGNLLSSAVPPQEYDLPHSSLLTTQSTPTKYSTAMSSISGPTVSMPETAGKPGGSYSAAPLAMPTAGLPAGAAAVPQHLPPVAQYSQPTLPLGHFANMIGYPFLQSYTYMPSAAAAFQQALASGTTYHQSPVAALHAAGLKYTLPQYKNTGAAVNNMPLSAPAVPSGLPGFGGSPTLPASHHLLLNPSAASVGSVSPYDDLLTAQYKEQQTHQYPAPPQQNESSMWLHGGGSRAPSGLSGGSGYYNLHQGPSQHGGAFRQTQQPSPYGGAAGYPNFYHSQGSATGQQDHLHSSGDSRLSGSQGAAAPPAAAHQHQHQMWQHNY